MLVGTVRGTPSLLNQHHPEFHYVIEEWFFEEAMKLPCWRVYHRKWRHYLVEGSSHPKSTVSAWCCILSKWMNVFGNQKKQKWIQASWSLGSQVEESCFWLLKSMLFRYRNPAVSQRDSISTWKNGKSHCSLSSGCFFVLPDLQTKRTTDEERNKHIGSSNVIVVRRRSWSHLSVVQLGVYLTVFRVYFLGYTEILGKYLKWSLPFLRCLRSSKSCVFH